MVHSRLLNHVLVLVTLVSIFSIYAEANRGFSWGWGGGSNYSSGSSSTPRSGWGWGQSFNYSGGSSRTPRSGWGWGQSFNYSGGSSPTPRSGWGWGQGFNYSGGSSPTPRSGWGWGPGFNYSGSSGSTPGAGWGWGWGGQGSNHSSGSGSTPGGGWGWGSSRNGNGWGWGWGWGWSRNNTYNSGSGSSGSSWGWGGHSKNYNATYNGPRKIIVGGDKEWTYGFNYADWASKTAPFFLNDILVFKYNPPAPFTHSVYMFPNPSSYEKCDVKKARMIASPKQGAGNGFEFVLNQMKPYFFACGEHDGAHCSNGTMKFTVIPMLPLS